MKKRPGKQLEKCRVKKGALRSDKSFGNNGMFLIPYKNNIVLTVVVSDGEEWKPIEGYEDLYEVSNMGEVRALPKSVRLPNGGKRIHDIHTLIPEVMEKGYVRVKLCNGGIDQKILIHRLVANAFIPNPHNYPEINHRNGKKDDNHVMNLEWCSASYNRHHAIENGMTNGLKVVDIEQIKSMLDEGMTPTQIAPKFETSRQRISDIKFGRHRSLEPDQPTKYEGIPFWDHVSVSMPTVTPTWRMMCFIKDLFFDEDETVLQYHPAKSDYVNYHPHCLHMWRLRDVAFPTPPTWMIGPE